MRIGELAGEAGVPAKTIRYYEELGLMPSPARTGSGYRDYDPSAVSRLRFIRSAQAMGLTLREIKRILDIRDGGRAPCEHVTALIERELEEVDERMAAMRRTRGELERLLARAATLDPADCDDSVVCHVIVAP